MATKKTKVSKRKLRVAKPRTSDAAKRVATMKAQVDAMLAKMAKLTGEKAPMLTANVGPSERSPRATARLSVIGREYKYRGGRLKIIERKSGRFIARIIEPARKGAWVLPKGSTLRVPRKFVRETIRGAK